MRYAATILIIITVLATAAGAAPGPVLVDVKTTLAGIVLADDLVEVGDRVEDGQVLVYVQTRLTGLKSAAARARGAGTVREVLVKPGQTVEQGNVVARVEPR